MTPFALWKFLHLVSNSLGFGGLLALATVQSLLVRSLEDNERKALAKSVQHVGRLVIAPAATVGFLAGLAQMAAQYSIFGMGSLMKCTPIYVHVMLATGLLSLGLTHAWAARTRKFSEALEKGETFANAKGHLLRCWGLAAGALGFATIAFFVAIAKVPNPILTRCLPPG